ncbi:peptidase S11 [Duganella sp. Leaf126]|uniref:D-alanyl-D-alanine endopeptidase n=1 Tax=Duganella sp. Leaf126 TaxID=1736266 RepID=UPI0006FF378A|nr:D-alanyl-D-alanine endopeptidase [Duganella sp. Leaf126]KQQ36280.1 peptidase S11 [Duganella sp. Leaf126]
MKSLKSLLLSSLLTLGGLVGLQAPSPALAASAAHASTSTQAVKSRQAKARPAKAAAIKAKQVRGNRGKVKRVKVERVKARQAEARQVKVRRARAQRNKARQVKAQQVTASKPVYQRRMAKAAAATAPSATHLAALRSSAVVIIDPATSDVLYQKNQDAVMPIASLTKLMTAMVVLDAGQSMTQQLTVTSADVDRLKYSSSRLQVGTTLPRASMLHLALMSSENRAASALGRNYPGGTRAFVAAMNAKARALGMRNTRYVEPTGLSSANVSTPNDLARLVIAAEKHAMIRQYSTDHQFSIRQGRSTSVYHNTNRLTASANWRIRLQKTGYISEAGRCMVLYTLVNNRPTVMVFLNSQGKYSHAADANRARSWLAGYRAGKVQHAAGGLH